MPTAIALLVVRKSVKDKDCLFIMGAYNYELHKVRVFMHKRCEVVHEIRLSGAAAVSAPRRLQRRLVDTRIAPKVFKRFKCPAGYSAADDATKVAYLKILPDILRL